MSNLLGLERPYFVGGFAEPALMNKSFRSAIAFVDGTKIGDQGGVNLVVGAKIDRSNNSGNRQGSLFTSNRQAPLSSDDHVAVGQHIDHRDRDVV